MILEKKVDSEQRKPIRTLEKDSRAKRF